MERLKIGIPRALYYYYFKDFYKYFFDSLDIDVIYSSQTNKKIVDDGINLSNDEMCMSLKVFLGHAYNLQGKCDYILVPRIDNYGVSNQTCTNFLALYDILNNLIDTKLLDYNIAYTQKETELTSLIKMGQKIKISRKKIIKAYRIAKAKEAKQLKKEYVINYNKLESTKIKILLVAHPYNIYDKYLGKNIIDNLNNYNVEIIYSDLFNNSSLTTAAGKLSKTLYWKYNKNQIGAIELVKNKIDGIIFLSSFPCGPDSLVNELVMRKITIPYINLIIDDNNIATGIETRIESFIDILERKKTIV